MKKIVGIVCGILLIIIVGMLCMHGNEKNTEIMKERTKVGFIFNGTIDDKGWGQSHFEGIERTAKKLNLSINYKENVPFDHTCMDEMQKMIDSGCKIIICNSFDYGDYVIKMAEKNPEIKFYHATGVQTAKNVSTYFGRMYQMRYLSGIVAGLQTENNSIGYVAAFPIAEVNRGINAFTQGVQSVNPDAKVHVIYSESWTDYAANSESANTLYEEYKADVLTMHCDTVAPLDVAEKQGIWSIGYNMDNSEEYPNSFLTASVWNWEAFYTPEILKCLKGKYQSNQYWEGVETGMIELAPLTVNVKAGIREVVEITKEDISEKELTLKIMVKDTGIGIREEDLQKLFVNFQRLDEEKNQGIEGTGLGLAITHKLTERMNGRIEVTSVYGEGSAFALYIPQGIVDAEEIGGFNVDSRMFDYRNPIGRFIAPDAKILVVDDNKMNVFVIKSLLKYTQAQVTACRSGQECLAYMEKESYDIVLLDHMMPKMDGIETIREILKKGLKRDTVVIALTANAIAGAREKYLSNGFDDYLSKPIEVLVLDQMLKKYIPKNKLQDVKQEVEVKNTMESIPDKKDWQCQYIDENVGLTYCAYSKDMYIEFLKMYYEGGEDKVKQLTQTFKEHKWKDYVTYVHSLKSTSLNIGGVQLSEYAEVMEQKGKEYLDSKEESALSYMLNHHEELMKLYQMTMQEVERMLADKKTKG